MENITVTKQSILDLYKTIRESNTEIANKILELFTPRPIGVWCLATNGDMVKPEDWLPGHEMQGVLVVSEKTSFVIAPCPSAALQFGAMGKAKSKLVRDADTLDAKAATDAIIAAYKGTHYTDKDSRIWDVDGAPAAEYCRQYSFGNIKEWDLPTPEWLSLMHQHRDEINDCFKAMGGYKLPAGYHWSCVEKDDTSALVVNIYDGGVSIDDKCYDSYVRPVSAFPL